MNATIIIASREKTTPVVTPTVVELLLTPVATEKKIQTF